MAIALGNSAALTADGNFTINNASGNNRILLIGVLGAGMTDALRTITSVKYNNVEATLIQVNSMNPSFYKAVHALYILKDSELPATSGAYAAAVTLSGTVTDKQIFLVELTGCNQTNPEASGKNAAAATTVSASVSTIADNAWMFVYGAGSTNTAVKDGSTTITPTLSVGSTYKTKIGYVEKATATTVTCSAVASTGTYTNGVIGVSIAPAINVSVTSVVATSTSTAIAPTVEIGAQVANVAATSTSDAKAPMIFTSEPVIEYITDEYNDGGILYDGSEWVLTPQGSAIGRLNGEPMSIYLLFDGVPIPSGATILTAKIRYYARYDNVYQDISSTIYANDVDNADTMSSYEDYTERVRTTNHVDWTFDECIADNYFESPDIKDVVQEIIDRSGWSLDNNILIMHDSTTTTGIDRYVSIGGVDNVPTQLIVYYVLNEGSHTNVTVVSTCATSASEAIAPFVFSSSPLELKASISNTGINNWDIYIDQYDLSLISGHSYTIRFKARSTVDRDIYLYLYDEEWSEQLVEIVSLTSSMTQYAFTFTPSEINEYLTILEFALGANASISTTLEHAIFIDDCEFYDNADNIEMLVAGDFNDGGQLEAWSTGSSGDSYCDFTYEVSATNTDATVESVVATSTSTALAPEVTAQKNAAIASVVATSSSAAIAPTVSATKNASITSVVATSQSTSIAPVITAIRNVDIQSVVATSMSAALTPSVLATINVTVQSVVATSTSNAIAPSVDISGSVVIVAPVAESTSNAIAPSVIAQRNVIIASAVATSQAQAIVPTIIITADVLVNGVAATSTSNAVAPSVTCTTNAIIASVVAISMSDAVAPSIIAQRNVSITSIVATSSSEAKAPVVTGEKNVNILGVVATTESSMILPVVTTTKGITITSVVAESVSQALIPEVIAQINVVINSMVAESTSNAIAPSVDAQRSVTIISTVAQSLSGMPQNIIIKDGKLYQAYISVVDSITIIDIIDNRITLLQRERRPALSGINIVG